MATAPSGVIFLAGTHACPVGIARASKRCCCYHPCYSIRTHTKLTPWSLSTWRAAQPGHALCCPGAPLCMLECPVVICAPTGIHT